MFSCGFLSFIWGFQWSWWVSLSGCNTSLYLGKCWIGRHELRSSIISCSTNILDRVGKKIRKMRRNSNRERGKAYTFLVLSVSSFDPLFKYIGQVHPTYLYTHKARYHHWCSYHAESQCRGWHNTSRAHIFSYVSECVWHFEVTLTFSDHHSTTSSTSTTTSSSHFEQCVTENLASRWRMYSYICRTVYWIAQIVQ